MTAHYLTIVRSWAVIYRPIGTFLLLCLSLLSCAGTEYRFERIDGEQPVTLPLKFDGLSGLRDGASVMVQGRFVNGEDVVDLRISLYLRPPAEFRSGTFDAMVEGRRISGTVDCPSLTFQGGQTALPNVGGVFILKDTTNRPIYRIRIPSTQLTRSAR